MIRTFHRWAVLAMLCLAAQANAALEGPLATAAWLQENLGREDLLVIDASSARAHAAGHVPGAVNVDLFAFGGNLVAPAEIERRMRAWGIDGRKDVVVYDPGGTFLATSLAYDLLHHGFPAPRLAVLDGGMAAWTAAAGTVTKDPTPKPVPGDFRVAPDESIRTRLPEFLVASGDPAGHALVEALEPAQHFGAMRFFDRAGHVPNAVMTPTGDFFNADKTFKSPAELRRMLAHLGVRPEQVIHSHCGGGIAASVPYYAMKHLLGWPRVKLYKESQLEWLRDDRGLPFWTYDAPHLVREKAWLNGWGGPMLRGFGVAKLAVVDVRPEAAFRQGRVPYAIHVPAEVFRRHLGAPAQLAEALGAAGVDAAHEAVVVSEGGLNPDSALAFLALESLGQGRVSLLADSVDDWGFAGLPLERDSDAPDPKKPPRAAFIKPLAYAAQPRAPAVIRDPRATQGAYPKVFVAAGKAMPAKVPEGKVVHVPYTDLVTAKGAPRPAGEIWTTLAKAGVSRYAEIVTFADDPGEAAAAYFVLRLMGFTDVKVWLS
jgi:thiosulfate/3-mercaptopyruvate sulfurtransferase